MNFAEILDTACARTPENVALRFGEVELTYRALDERIDRLAAALAASGVRPGEFVAVISSNSNAYLECVMACARIGAVSEQYNTRLSPLVIRQLLERSSARIVLLSRGMYQALREQLDDLGREMTLVIAEDPSDPAQTPQGAGALGKNVLWYEALLAAHEPLAARTPVDPDDPAVMLYTSGTTGMPKGVLLSHAALAWRIATDAREMRFASTDVLLCVLPLFHVTSMSAYVTFFVGAELVLAPSRRAATVARMLSEEGITRTALVPFLMRELAEWAEAGEAEVPQLDYVVYGGEPADPALLSRFRRLFGCGLIEGYGMTETTSAITMLLPEHHEDPRLLSTVGTVVPGMEIRLVDEDGADCPAGTCGEVLVKTPTLMLGYYRDPERTAAAICDGWYRTGDIGMLDEQGFLTLVDRKNNLVITGGENVYPLEVSRCILSMGEGAVRDAVVVGVPDPRWGETLAAFVVRAEGAQITEQDVIDWCATRIGSYKKPHKVVFVESLMRSPSGKIPKKYLTSLIDVLG